MAGVTSRFLFPQPAEYLLRPKRLNCTVEGSMQAQVQPLYLAFSVNIVLGNEVPMSERDLLSSHQSGLFRDLQETSSANNSTECNTFPPMEAHKRCLVSSLHILYYQQSSFVSPSQIPGSVHITRFQFHISPIVPESKQGHKFFSMLKTRPGVMDWHCNNS